MDPNGACIGRLTQPPPYCCLQCHPCVDSHFCRSLWGGPKWGLHWKTTPSWSSRRRSSNTWKQYSNASQLISILNRTNSHPLSAVTHVRVLDQCTQSQVGIIGEQLNDPWRVEYFKGIVHIETHLAIKLWNYWRVVERPLYEKLLAQNLRQLLIQRSSSYSNANSLFTLLSITPHNLSLRATRSHRHVSARKITSCSIQSKHYFTTVKLKHEQWILSPKNDIFLKNCIISVDLVLPLNPCSS